MTGLLHQFNSLSRPLNHLRFLFSCCRGIMSGKAPLETPQTPSGYNRGSGSAAAPQDATGNEISPMAPTATAARLEVQIPLRVKPYDIDIVGVVSNIVYVRWMEDLRLAMLDAYLPLDEQMADGIIPAILKVELNYKRAIQIHDEVVGAMWLSGLEKLRFEVSAEFRANNHVAAFGRQEGCFISLSSKRPVRPPARLVSMFRNISAP